MSGVSAGAAVMAVAQNATAADYDIAVLSRAQREARTQGAALLSLIESAGAATQVPPRAEGVGQNLSVYA